MLNVALDKSLPLHQNVNWLCIMASSHFEKIIKDFSGYFGIVLKNLTFAYDNRIPIAQIGNKNEAVNGLRNLVSQVSNSDDPEKIAVQDQWIEYTLTRMEGVNVSIASQDLKELNEYMGDKVYFVGNQFGPIDILMYYLLYHIMTNLTFQEKEKYIHTSRWFNNVQQNENARSWRSIIPFSRSCLYA